jgi:hypothetical protein
VNPDQQVSRDRIRYDAKAAALAGRRVLEARYWDVHNFDAEARQWDYGDWHHAIMGVELRTDRGPSCVRGSSTFQLYGAEVFHTPMSEHLRGIGEAEGPESRDVSDSDRWRDRLNSPVADVQTSWNRFTIGPTYRRSVRIEEPYQVDIPVALRIGFPAGPLWMVAGNPKWPEMREVFVPGDEIMVVFTAERMRQIGFPDSEFLTDSPD